MEAAIYNIKGQKVRTLLSAKTATSTLNLVWDGKDTQQHKTAPGIYFLQLRQGQHTVTAKLALVE